MIGTAHLVQRDVEPLVGRLADQPVPREEGRPEMTVRVDLRAAPDGADPTITFSDGELADPGSVYCYHVGSGGELIILVDEHGESHVHRVYSPVAWHCVEGDVWRKGVLLQG